MAIKDLNTYLIGGMAHYYDKDDRSFIPIHAVLTPEQYKDASEAAWAQCDKALLARQVPEAKQEDLIEEREV